MVSMDFFSLPSLGSDNHAGVHPEILKAIERVNVGHSPSYGSDEYTQKVIKGIKALFGERAEPFFVFNGTAANVLCLKGLLRSHEAVICAETAHLHLDECGAPEAAIGCKVLTVPTSDGKLRPQDLEKYLIRGGDQHYAQPKVLSITQPTEVGTCYTLQELRELREFTWAKRIMLHIDGARLIHAAHFLNCTLKDLTENIGVDAVSFGGTKNGLLFGEIVLLYNAEAAQQMKFVRKQCMQLPSKMRFLAAQFEALLLGEKPLYQTISREAHELARRLEAGLREIPEVTITQKVEANSVFARLPKSWVKPLRQKYFFYIWDEKTFEARLMISHSVTADLIDGFIAECKSLANA